MSERQPNLRLLEDEISRAAAIAHIPDRMFPTGQPPASARLSARPC